MKIRLLSFQNANNFGAVLQAFGLQQTILSMGYKDVKFINYNPKYLSERYNPFSKERILSYMTLKGVISYFFFLISSLQRKRCFNYSISTMLSQTNKRIVDSEGLKEESADVLICGSDQIWNTALTGDFDPVFLGKGPYKHLGYAVSYAPSTELSSLTENGIERLCSMLDGFKYISVREEPVKIVLQNHFSREIKVCVDPTILCGSDAYDKISSPRIEKKDYILVYTYDPNESLIKNMINSIPNSDKYTVHTILLEAKNIHNFFDKRIHSGVILQNFLSYFKYASFIVTNSFHGLAFSLLFQRNFNVAFCKDKSTRCISLLHQLDLDSRLVKEVKSICWDELNYDTINFEMEKIRRESYNYLLNALEG